MQGGQIITQTDSQTEAGPDKKCGLWGYRLWLTNLAALLSFPYLKSLCLLIL